MTTEKKGRSGGDRATPMTFIQKHFIATDMPIGKYSRAASAKPNGFSRHTLAGPQQASSTANIVGRIREALSLIDPSDRDLWVTMGMAVHSELGDVGFEIWDGWSQRAVSYCPRAAASTWKSFHAGGKVTIGTLFYEAKANDWRDEGTYQKPTAEELAERQRIATGRSLREDAETARQRKATAEKAAAIWSAATDAQADHPYLLRKQIAPVSTLREINADAAAAILGYVPTSDDVALTGRLLVAPIKVGNALSSLELIDVEGRKTALAGRGTKAGGFWTSQPLPESNGKGLTLLIGEGVATVLSGQDASGHLAIAALSASNLMAVAKVLRERYPAAALVILADLVKATGEADPRAITAAQAVGGVLAIPAFGDQRPEGAKDFNDLAVLRGQAAVAQAIASALADPLPLAIENNAPARDTEGNDWPEPQPMAAKVEALPYPIDALPTTVRAAVEEVAGYVKAPLAMVASSALAAMSVAIQAHVDVKRAEKLLGPTGLFLLTIADSGERKSSCDDYFTKPIHDYEAAEAKAGKAILKDYKVKYEAWETKIGGLKDQLRQRAKSGKPTHDVEAALRELEHEKPESVRLPRLLYTDATPEALGYGLAKQWPSGAVISSEAGIVLGSHGMGKDSAMRNMGLMNQLWDGKSLKIERRSTESYTVRGARLTMALQVQELTLREFLARTGSLARGTGFFARFLLAVPESTQGFRFFSEAPVNWPHLMAFHQRITAILQQPVPMDDEGALTPPQLPLTTEAKASWVVFHNAIESELHNGGALYAVRDIASKSADNAARLAALFHIFEGGGGAIGAAALEGACRLAVWHLNEARRFFGELALPAELANAARLDTWLIAHCQRERTHFVGKNHIRQYGPLRDGATLDAAIRELTALDRVRLDHDGKRQAIKVNPALVIEGGTS